MCLHHIDEYKDYLAYLRKHPPEVEALVKDMLITVTDFFREPESWNELRQLAIQPMVERKKSDEPIRIWTAGCATGEEPYTVAILILDELKRTEKNCPLNVFASDIDKDAIQFARAGRYPKSIEADVFQEKLRQYFSANDSDDYYYVNKELRESVVFAEQNLIADPPFSKLDLICCRNVLIYLKPEIQEKIIGLFHFALCDDGVLFLGSAESVGRQADLFRTLHKRWRIFRRIGPTRHDRVDFPVSRVAHHRELQSIVPFHRETRLSNLAKQRLLDMLAPSAVLVDRNWAILYICGDVDRYLALKPGTPNIDLLDNARRGLRSKLRIAVQRAFSLKQPISVMARVLEGVAYQPVGITVRVIHDPGQIPSESLALVMFEDQKTGRRSRTDSRDEMPSSQAQPVTAERSRGSDASDFDQAEVLDDHAVIRQLEEELTATKDDLQAMLEQVESSNEEFKASNEEVMSINEELQSTNEELETSKEELQSLNEELSTVNSQLAAKVEELETKHTDLENLLAATDVATICLDTDLVVRWFTPPVKKMIRLRDSDKGRQLADFTDDFIDNDLVAIAERVFAQLVPVEDEAACVDGRTFLRRITPYRGNDHRIGGIVMTFVDITERKKSELAVLAAKEMSDKIIDTVRTSILVLDMDLRVVSANRSFYETFLVSPHETEGRLIYELCDNRWDIPELRQLLEEVLPQKKAFDDYQVEHHFESIGRRVMLLQARNIDHLQRILLCIQDIT